MHTEIDKDEFYEKDFDLGAWDDSIYKPQYPRELWVKWMKL